VERDFHYDKSHRGVAAEYISAKILFHGKAPTMHTIHTRGGFWYLIVVDTSAYCQPKSTAYQVVDTGEPTVAL